MNKFTTVLALTTALAACGGGDAASTGSTVGTPKAIEIGTISGLITPSATNASITLLTSTGEALLTTTPNIDGEFSFTGEFATGNYKINLLHSGLAEHTIGKSKAGSLQANLDFIEANDKLVQINPVTSLLSLTNSTGLNQWLGFDSQITTPANISDPVNAGSDLSDEILYDLFIKSLSIASEQLGKRDTQEFYELLLQDLRADNKLDGLGLNSASLSYNGNEISSDVYRRLISESILIAANQEQNVTLFKEDTADAFVNIFANNTNILLETPEEKILVGSNAFDFEIDLTEGQSIYGLHNAIMQTSHSYKIESSIININGQTVASGSINSKDVSYLINTTTIEDGQVVVEFVTTLFDGQIHTKSFNLEIYNESVFLIVNNSEHSNQALTTLNFELGGQSKEVDFVRIDGRVVEAVDGIFTPQVSLNSGVNTVSVALVLKSGVVESLPIIITLDTQAPVITEVGHSYESGYKVPTYNTGTDTVEDSYLQITSGKMLVLTEGSSSIGFTSPTYTNLTDSGYTFFQGRVTEGSTDNIDLEGIYTTSVNGVDISHNTNLEIDADGEFIVPISTEYFGSKITENDQNNIFNIKIQITDLAGNTETKNINFQVMHVTYDIIKDSEFDENFVFTNTVFYELEGNYVDAVSVTFSFNDYTVLAADPAEPKFSIDTTLLDDGATPVTFEVLTKFGDTYTATFTLNIDNSPPTITTDLVVDASSKTHTINGVINDVNGVYSLMVGTYSISVNPETGTFSYTKTLEVGTQYIELVAIDSRYNRGTTTIEVTYNPYKPTIGISTNTLSQKVWQEINSEHKLDVLKFYLEPVISIHNGSKDYLGLNGTVDNLIDNNIPFIEFTSKIQNIDSTYTNPLVTYSLTKNDVVITADAILNPTDGFSYIIPLTEETFGLDWFVGSDDDIFELTIFATGNDNERKESYLFRTTEASTQVDNLSSPYFTSVDNIINMTGSDLVGLSVIELEINGVTYNSTSTENLSFIVNLGSLADGEHEAKLTLLDRKGTRLVVNQEIVIDNSEPQIIFTLPEITNLYFLPITGVLVDDLSGATSLTIDGEDVSFNSSTGEFNFSLVIDETAGHNTEGKNYSSTHSFLATDALGNTVSFSRSIKVDRMGAFAWNQGVTVSGKYDTECDGTITGAAQFHGRENNSSWIIYSNTKTLNGTSILDDEALDDKDIGYFKFYAWSHVRNHYGILNTLTDVKYTYSINGTIIFENKTLEIAINSGDKQVNEFRIALTEEYLGAGFNETAANASHSIKVTAYDEFGQGGSVRYNFRICDYASKGINI